ncbi:sigma-70 family RNA polymerase sigma factor [Sinomonas halotolerans]|uniref:Sigma-70 family RNA polymerase sigma factor n=1 Tax=Sinomonas halotolerans TaxID=1644133 RepID=A0ABU9X0B2_9MICC
MEAASHPNVVPLQPPTRTHRAAPRPIRRPCPDGNGPDGLHGSEQPYGSEQPLRPRAERSEAPQRSVPMEEAAGDDAAAALATDYLGVADALARRFRCPGHDADDLRQVARLGLMKAARRYREALGHGFVPYAVPTITGELKRYLRDQSWVIRPPRSIQELRLKINALRPALTQELGHDPTTAELSTAAGVPAMDVAEAQMADASLVTRPVEHGDGSDDSEEPRVGITPSALDPGFERVEALHALAGALEDSTAADRRLLTLRFVEEKTQSEIARELGVSQMQVSRLLKKLLDRLRRRMAA